MRLTFKQPASLRKTILALAALAAATAAGPALAWDNDGVIVASSSPRYAVGRVVAIGERLRLESGATITILDESGRVTTVSSDQQRYQPQGAAPRAQTRPGPSIVDSISALISSDRNVRTPGGVRSYGDRENCAVDLAEARIDTLQRALEAHCDAEAVALIQQMVRASGPPQLYASLMEAQGGRGSAIGVQVQANFDAYLYCRLRRPDQSLLAITPEIGALPMRVNASSGYEFLFPGFAAEQRGAVQCMAIAPGDGAATPDVGEWPLELDPERSGDEARVASVQLSISPR